MSINKSHQDNREFLESRLFVEMQQAAVVIDPKTLADALPLYPLDDIAAAYSAESGLASFDAGLFLERHFELPTGTLRDHLLASPESFVRGAPPVRYLVPGSRFREGYYWDTYFTLLLFEATGRREMIREVIAHFADQQATYGLIPNGTRPYYLTRSQPPVLALIVDLLKPDERDAATKATALAALKNERAFWDMPDRSVARRNYGEGGGARDGERWRWAHYSDTASTPRPESLPFDLATAADSEQDDAIVFRNLRAAAESGWDFSSRWLRTPNDLSSIHTRDILPVDLNALLYMLDETIADLTPGEDRMAPVTVKAFNDLFWNPDLGWYFDVDHRRQQQTSVESLAGVVPLVAGLADAAQAQQVRDVLMDRFLRDGGLVASLHTTGEQWDAPNGWAPLHYFATTGLRRYGFDADADLIADRWVRTVRRHFHSTGQIYEKYDVVAPDRMAGGGEYPVQGGFGWTNGVTAAFLGLSMGTSS